MLCLYKYWNILRTFPLRLRILLFSLRTITIISLIILLINPWINVKRYKKFPQKIDVIFDHSESLKHHYVKGGIQPKQIKQKINSWSSSNNVNINFYRLGDKIEILENFDHYDISTDFSHLQDFIAYELPDQLLLITDGVATVGRELNDLNFPGNIPVHILGVGAFEEGDDLIIKEIDVPTRSMQKDTVMLVLKLESQVAQLVTSKLQILNDTSIDKALRI